MSSFCGLRPRPPYWGALSSNPHQGLFSWTLLGDFRPQTPCIRLWIRLSNDPDIYKLYRAYTQNMRLGCGLLIKLVSCREQLVVYFSIASLLEQFGREQCCFDYYQQLHGVHNYFHQQLCKAVSKEGCLTVGDCFLTCKERFLVHGDYCANLLNAQELIEKLTANSASFNTRLTASYLSQLEENDQSNYVNFVRLKCGHVTLDM